MSLRIGFKEMRTVQYLRRMQSQSVVRLDSRLHEGVVYRDFKDIKLASAHC